MRFVNAAIVLLALLATLGGYFQEKKRLGEIRALSAAAARDLYEKAQARRDRMMLLVTAALVAGAVAALIAFKVQAQR
jgi:hypothetical protein